LSLEESKAERFNSLLIEVILECVEFGEVVLRFLELNSPFRREEVAEKPELFAREIEDLLGDCSKITLERIIQSLYAKLGIENARIKDGTFSECIKTAFKEYFKQQG